MSYIGFILPSLLLPSALPAFCNVDFLLPVSKKGMSQKHEMLMSEGDEGILFLSVCSLFGDDYVSLCFK